MASTGALRPGSGTPGLVRLRLLGGFRAEWDGEAVPDSVWRRRSGKTLVKMLAVAPEHRLHREVLIDRLWPEAEPAVAGNSLHQALRVVRRVFDAPRNGSTSEPCVRLVGDLVTLSAQRVSIDIDEFEELASRGLKLREVRELTAAADAYGGELLPEDRYEDWAEERRAPLVRLYVQVLLTLAEVLEGRGAWFAAIERAQQALAADTTREEAHRLLMRLYALSSHRDQALRQYHDCRQLLADELGAEPDDTTSALYEDILSGRLSGAAHDEELGPVPLPVVPRRLAHSIFAGRERPLGIFRDKLAQLHAGSGGVVFISGEAGVGKTRLAVEAAVSADELDMLVLWGTSYAEEGQLPYGAMTEALEGYLGSLPADMRERLVRSYPELTRLISSVSASSTSSQGADGTRMQLFAAIGRFLSEISTTRPLLLVLDDLHAADEVSVQLVHYLARLAQQHPWLLVVTFREEEVRPGDALQGVVTACVRRGLADRIELLRLARSEAYTLASSLLEGELDEGLMDQLFSLSLGNALFLLELIHSMRESGHIEQAAGRWRATAGRSMPVPPGAAELVTARAARLSADATRVVGLAAVVGMECPLELLHQASELTEGSLLTSLEEIDALRIMHVRTGAAEGKEHRYGFRHPLFREALYAEIPGPRRHHLHALVGRAMETVSPDEVDALAYHWTHAGNDPKATHYLERAGDRAISRYAHESAAAYYRDAIARIDEHRDSDQAARLQTKLGKVLTRTGQYDDALLLLDASRRYYELTGNLEELVRTVAALTQTHRERGTSNDGLAVARELLPRMGGGDDLAVSVDAAIDLYLALASASRAVGQIEETVRMAETAGDLARAAGNDQALASAELRRGDGLGSLGRVEEGIRILEDCKVLAEKVGNMVALAGVLTNAGALYASLDDHARSMEYRERAAELFGRLGYPAHQAFALSMLSATRYASGQWDEARGAIERVLEIHESIDVSWYLTYALCTLGDIELGCGDSERAWESFSRAHALTTARPDPQIKAWIERGLAEAELLAGRPEAARARLSSVLAAPETDDSDVVIVTRVLTDALLELDQLDEAEESLRTVFADATATTMSGEQRAGLLCTRGKLLSRRERWDEAALALREAVAIARPANVPLLEGRAWFEMGMLAARRGDGDTARESFRRALTIFQALGARALLQQTQSALRGLA